MTHFGFQWPEALDCAKLPAYGEKLCVGNNETTTPSKSVSRAEQPPRMPIVPEFQQPYNTFKTYQFAFGARDLGFACPVHFKVPHFLGYSLKVGDKVEHNCGAPCDGMFFTDWERKFSRVWIGTWASVCAASCFFTFLTFLIDTNRFR